MTSSIEHTVLGMCLSSAQAFEQVVAAGVHPACFDTSEAAEIYGAMLEVDRAGLRVDLEAIATKTPRHALRLVELIEQAPPMQNVDAYAKELVARFRQRQIEAELVGLVGAVKARKLFDPVDRMDKQLTDAIDRLMASATMGSGPVKIDQAIDKLNPEIERQYEQRQSGAAPGIPTGFAVLDLITGGGFGKGTLNVAAARTGKGKTTLAVNFLHTAAMQGYACAYFTVEMSTSEILRKLLSLAGKVNQTKLRIGDLTQADFDRLFAAQRRLYDKPVWFDDKTKASFERVEMACRKLKRQGPLDLVVIDYIQQFAPEGKWRTTHDRLTEVSHRLKQLANELGIAVIALAQLNRDAEKGEQKPDVHHIKDSGSIEQDADLILLIHDELHGQTSLFVGKNRHGRGRIDFPIESNLAFNEFKHVNVNLEAFR